MELPLYKIQALYSLAQQIEDANIKQQQEDAKKKKAEARKKAIEGHRGIQTMATMRDLHNNLKQIDEADYSGSGFLSQSAMSELADELED